MTDEEVDSEGRGREPVMAVDGEILVRFKSEAGRRRARLAADMPGNLRWLVPERRIALAGHEEPRGVEQMAVVSLPEGTDLERAAKTLERRPDVLYAEPNYRLHTCVESVAEPGGEAGEPSDFEFDRQWALRNRGQTGGTVGADIRALEAWTQSTGSRDVVVAIIDTGIDFFHPDLEANIWRNPKEVPGNGQDDDGNGFVDDVHGYDFVSDDGDPMDDNLHGTHVAGILAAVGNDENGISGVAWSAGLMALKAFDETGGGSLDDTIAAVAYAESAGARVINASWGTTTRSRGLDEAVADAVRRGVVVIAAAGNNGSDVGFHPAAVPEAIAVGATDAKDKSANFSNHGTFVDVVAPGDSIYSTAPNATWTLLSGTSMAAPHVSGLAVLLLARRPSFTPGEIGAILRSTAEEVATDRFTGAGRIHAGRAVGILEPLPKARLAVPKLLSGRMDWRGEAGGVGFAGYTVELGAGSRPTQWEVVGAGGQEVSANGVLVPALDTSRFDDGEYAIRLSVTNRGGQAAVERARVEIRNVRLTSPLNNDIRRGGGLLELRGTVFGDGRTYTVAWGLGVQPTVWNETGLVVSGNGEQSVVDGLLATWDPAVAGAERFVTFRVEAWRDGRRVGDSYARMVHIESRLRPGWPLYFPFEEEFPEANWREFNVADLDGDGTQEVILVDHGEPGGRAPRLIVLEANGTERWSRQLASGAPEYDAPVVGDIEGDGSLEVFVDTGSEGRIAAFSSRGEPLGGRWPVAPGGSHYGKIMADVDADGRLEVIALSNPPADLVGAAERRLIVLRGSGETMAEWRFAACRDTSELTYPEQLPAVGNFDDDAGLEIVVVDGCLGVSAFDVGRPEGPLWTSVTEANLRASPVVGDLDGDGREEVVIGGVPRDTGLTGGIHVISSDGRPRPGWPALREQSFPSSAALGDLDGDDRLDIVIASWDSRTIHAISASGFENRGWPLPAQTAASTRSVPVIGDVDGDGRPDVVMASPGFWLQVLLGGDISRVGGIRAWNSGGELIDFHPGLGAEGLVTEAVGGAALNRLPPAVLADLDGDGVLDVVAGTIQDRAYSPTPPVTMGKARSTLYAWNVGVPFQKAANPWPMYQGGPQRTGRYFRPRPPNQPPVIRDLPDQTVATGEAFRSLRLDRYVVDPDDARDRLVWEIRGAAELKVIVDEGRVARISAPSPAWEGTERLEFVVRDLAGAEARETVMFSIRPGYRPPVAEVDLIETQEETAVEFDPLVNDRSPLGRILRVGGVSAPGNGRTRLLADGRLRYEPEQDFFGEDSLEYTVLDDDGGLATAEVRIRVSGTPDPPVADVDRLIVDEDTSGEVFVLENDSDVDGEAVSLVDVAAPAEGVFEPLGDARFRFVPPPDWSGFQSILYRVRDPGGLMATGEVAVLVRPVNDPPVVKDQEIQLNRNKAADIFYDAKDADAETLRFTIVESPAHGVLLAYPTIANYEPKKGFTGTDRFTYTATDGKTSAGPATVRLVVGDRNNPPIAESVEMVTAVDQELTVGLKIRDADDDPVTIRISDIPEHGSAELRGTNAVYRPGTGYVGEDRFTILASDGKEDGELGKVTIRVTDQNTPPVSRSEILTVARNQATALTLVAVDGENNPLEYKVVVPPVYGTLEGDPPRVTYRPKNQFRGLDRLDFVAMDRRSTSEVAVVHLLVRDPNQAPAVTNQTVQVRRGEPAAVNLSVTDADMNPLRIAILKGPRFGRVHGLGMSWTYVPRSGFEGLDSFTYKAWDGGAYSAEGKVNLEVRGDRVVPIEIVQIQRTPDGMELSVRGGVGRTLRIEVSFDLEAWETVVRLPAGAEVVRWLDVGSGSTGARFYRVAEEVFGGNP